MLLRSNGAPSELSSNSDLMGWTVPPRFTDQVLKGGN